MPLFERLRKAVKRVANTVDKAVNPDHYLWDMSSREARVRQVTQHFEDAKTARETFRKRLETNERYYRGEHDAKHQLLEYVQDNGMHMEPPVLPDPYIQVEAQIDDIVPEVQFKGRDDVTDPANAKIREEVVQFIWYDNHIEELNLNNERSLMMSGNAFYKLAWDAQADVMGPGGKRLKGRIEIGDPDPANIFPDPTAYTLDDCEYIIHAYRMHRRKARRLYPRRQVDALGAEGDYSDTEFYEDTMPVDEDTVQIIEYWYRDDDGDIALSIVIGKTEVRHVKKFWAKTRESGCKLYPFVHYRRIPIRKNFWGMGEIDMIRDLVDASDRTFNNALMNDGFMGNDITHVDGPGFVEGYEPVNEPGAIWQTKAGTTVRRLGSISNASNALNIMSSIHDKIEETNGNYNSAQGKEPTRVTTASGIAQLNERADKRQGLKKAGRIEGYRRLALLTDWMALEFYDEARVIVIRGAEEQSKVFNPAAVLTPSPNDPLVGYYPTIDVEISVGDGIKKSKAFTLAATQELAEINVTPANYMIVKSIVDLLDLPNKQEIMQAIDTAVQLQIQQTAPPGGAIPPGGMTTPGADPVARFQAALAADPELAQMVSQLPPEQQQQVMQQVLGGGQ